MSAPTHTEHLPEPAVRPCTRPWRRPWPSTTRRPPCAPPSRRSRRAPSTSRRCTATCSRRILADTGAAWQTGRAAIWEEHLASATVRTIVEIVYPGVLKAKAAVAPSGRTVLLACPPEEGHDLGLRMVADRFDMAGWTTYFLGPDTPVAEIADAARRLGVDAVVMSSSTHFHRLAVRHAVDALKKELPGMDIWVGGPAFGMARGGPDELLDRGGSSNLDDA